MEKKTLARKSLINPENGEKMWDLPERRERKQMEKRGKGGLQGRRRHVSRVPGLRYFGCD